MNPVLVAVIERLMDDIGDKIAVDVPMGALTTYRVGGRAAAMVVVDDHETLSAVAAAVAGTGIPVMTLGRGSNMLVADRGFDGLVVHMAGDYAAINVVDETIVIAGGGETAGRCSNDGRVRPHWLRVGGRCAGFDRRRSSDECRWPRRRHEGRTARRRRR